MQKSEYLYSDRVLSLALDLGKNMVKCGAEINRVEETVVRICYAYKMRSIDVFSIISMIEATVTDEKGNTHTQLRRIYTTSTNFGRLEKLNELSRKICSTVPDVDVAAEELNEIINSNKKYSVSVLLGHMLAAGSFTLFFGGRFFDAIASVIIAAVIWFLNSYIKTSGVNRLFFTVVTSAVTGFLAMLFVSIGLGYDSNLIMIGDIMLIIPGLKLINSVREMLCGDLMSGLLRLLESIVISVAIAGGFALVILVTEKVVTGG